TPYTQAQQPTTKAEPTPPHVGTGPLARPGGPAVPVRSAVAPTALSPHNLTKPIATNPANSTASVTPRKRPAPVQESLPKKMKGSLQASS
ncbi:MAG TPA: hypothetical protein VF123_05350, partial [Candidatus Sulfotelmatobacter sp.]